MKRAATFIPILLVTAFAWVGISQVSCKKITNAQYVGNYIGYDTVVVALTPGYTIVPDTMRITPFDAQITNEQISLSGTDTLLDPDYFAANINGDNITITPFITVQGENCVGGYGSLNGNKLYWHLVYNNGTKSFAGTKQ